MIQETELNLFVPSPELLVRLASGERPLGIRVGPPRIKSLRETFFDTADQALRRRGMTCKLRQVDGEQPSIVVTVGEGPDSEGITSRSRLTAAAIGAGVFETLRGDSEPAAQVQKFVDPSLLRPQIALDIQRLGRVYRGGLFLKPVFLLFFDRITVQAGESSSVFHELSIRRRREGGPLIRDIGRQLKDEYHLFPDGLTTLQRAYRVLAVGRKSPVQGFSPYGLNLALAVFWDGKLGLKRKGEGLHIPTFSGSGEDAARALAADLTGDPNLPLLRLGTTELREGRNPAELWTIPNLIPSSEAQPSRAPLTWIPWHGLLEEVGRQDLQDQTLVGTLLLLTRKRLLGQLPWVPGREELQRIGADEDSPALRTEGLPDLPRELLRVEALLPLLMEVEDVQRDLETRLKAASRLSAELDHVFLQDIARAKGKILSGKSGEGEEAPILLVDLLSIRIRGIVDRLNRCMEEDLLGKLEAADIHLRTWVGLMHGDRVALLEQFSSQHLPHMQVAPEWGPSFIPEMPLSGCAVGILARIPGAEGNRFFHMVLRKDPPSFLTVPGSAMVLPIEEVIRGYFLTQMPELERAETFMFRFMTAGATVREVLPSPDPPRADLAESGEDGEDEDEDGGRAPSESLSLPPVPTYVETRQSVVVRVLVHQKMPESYQAQLLRALERQVTRRNPMIGWSDLYPVTGPLEWSGLDQLLDLQKA